MRNVFFVFIIFLFISGCSSSAEEKKELESGSTFNEQIESVDVASIDSTEIALESPYNQSYGIYVCVEDYKESMYEPDQGCYIGANIIDNKTILSDIEKFEALTLKDHTLYANVMKLGAEYPYSWILECVAKQKTPILTVNPPNSYDPYQMDLLVKTAKEAAELNIPMFVQFYPYASNENYKANDYITFYREAYAMFKKYAPSVGFCLGRIWGRCI